MFVSREIIVVSFLHISKFHTDFVTWTDCDT